MRLHQEAMSLHPEVIDGEDIDFEHLEERDWYSFGDRALSLAWQEGDDAVSHTFRGPSEAFVADGYIIIRGTFRASDLVETD